jgi:hypothetical protein
VVHCLVLGGGVDILASTVGEATQQRKSGSNMVLLASLVRSSGSLGTRLTKCGEGERAEDRRKGHRASRAGLGMDGEEGGKERTTLGVTAPTPVWPDLATQTHGVADSAAAAWEVLVWEMTGEGAKETLLGAVHAVVQVRPHGEGCRRRWVRRGGIQVWSRRRAAWMGGRPREEGMCLPGTTTWKL